MEAIPADALCGPERQDKPRIPPGSLAGDRPIQTGFAECPSKGRRKGNLYVYLPPVSVSVVQSLLHSSPELLHSMVWPLQQMLRNPDLTWHSTGAWKCGESDRLDWQPLASGMRAKRFHRESAGSGRVRAQAQQAGQVKESDETAKNHFFSPLKGFCQRGETDISLDPSKK